MTLKRTFLTLSLVFSIAVLASAQQFKALVYTKTAGFRHQSIPNAVVAMKKMGEKQVFSVYTSEDPKVLEEESLMKYDVLILISTTGTIFDEKAQASLQKFVQAGKGVVGVHAAADSEYQWPWYNKMMGAYFLSHPALGHVDSAWEDDVFLKHLYGGIWYAATGHPFK